VVRGKTGRVKQDLIRVNGRTEHHPEGYDSLDWREGGRRHRMSLGKDASAAQLAWERHAATEGARAMGIAVAGDRCATSLGGSAMRCKGGFPFGEPSTLVATSFVLLASLSTTMVT